MSESSAKKLYFVGIQDKKEGPFSVDEIRELLRTGKISLQSLIWKKGLANWSPLEDLIKHDPDFAQVPPLLPESGSTPIIDLIDLLLKTLRGPSTDSVWFIPYAHRITLIGGYAVLVGGILIFLRHLIVGIKNISADSLGDVLMGLAALLVAVVLHYVGMKFSRISHDLIKNNRLHLPSFAVPHALALLCLMAALGLFVAFLIWAIREEAIPLFLMGCLLSVVVIHGAILFSRPEGTTNTWLAESPMRAGEYGFHLLAYFARLWVALSPFLFGFGAVFASLGLLYTAFTISTTQLFLTDGFFRSCSSLLLFSALIPLLIHIGYLIFMAGIDFIGAVFQIERNTTPTK